jgi:hypothetical protein
VPPVAFVVVIEPVVVQVILWGVTVVEIAVGCTIDTV